MGSSRLVQGINVDAAIVILARTLETSIKPGIETLDDRHFLQNIES